jgi:hypothetical protein
MQINERQHATEQMVRALVQWSHEGPKDLIFMTESS